MKITLEFPDDLIVSSKDIRNGQPVIAGTRFPISMLLAEILFSGIQGDEILQNVANDFNLDYNKVEKIMFLLAVQLAKPPL